ncbi:MULTISPECIES: acyl-CoA dehydrogenase family protein [Alphaproteobacteria]|uniref:Acyl-CoA dehydrogenase n=2 Tax=Alphaproteobacteria TaxID=28211 RepID=A0A512HH27_9HYPH|nr:MULTISPECIES: acyl-CoA dehydrogenase family protein [Alphaproteobacteria]GEO84757.1 acyl-CoA dehydrogenase [Ciceribacter naphthalenivorans]GLR20622.1 acyl-CoA dehydrogenase [Ciceribacter naphthalenivorans]GLT03478.1 acyl-CoA dehydrogenase [Sphingomonas psychrolutea]
MSLDQAERTLRLLKATPGWTTLCAARPDCDLETAGAILDAARKMAEDTLSALGPRADEQGCRLEEGRVKTPDGYRQAWTAYAEGGWLALDLPEEFGGSGLPLTLQAAMLPLCERHATAFMMAAGATRAAAHLLAEHADRETADTWVPRLASGEWAATICISEPDAGSDVGRIRMRAEQTGDGWSVTGEKIWISFGDHDLVARIGHCVLARSEDRHGTRGLSLFLVPSTRACGSSNGITIQRLEEKMGMHGSPTCAMAFETSEAILIGERGRGLPQLFTMIELMRLQTGCQGLGIATMACEIAEAYAEERRQGGRPDAGPVVIAHHPDVARMLSEMRSETEALRAAVLEMAITLDLSRIDGRDSDAAALAAFLLPLIKNFGAAAGAAVADIGIQVLGGAGYTKEWPLEQGVRDARVLTIYEGTTGMQALDLLIRRLWADRRGLDVFLTRARAETENRPEARTIIEAFAELADAMAAHAGEPGALYGANAYLNAAWRAFKAWMAPRLDPAEAAPLLAQGREYMALLRAQALAGTNALTEAENRGRKLA